MIASALEPIHFGPGDRLFGLRSEPVGAPRSSAVVICQTWGPEYMRSYRGIHLLAAQLAQRGFDTLRFDYSSTGDSADHAGEAALEHWIDDIRSAVDELRELSGAARICLLGLRLGGLLAAQAVAQGARAERLALWDVPAAGSDWVEDLSTLNREHYERKNRHRPSWLHLRLPRDELLGAPWPAALETAVASLRVEPVLPAAQMLLLQSPDLRAGASAQQVRCVALPEPAHWTEIERLDTPWSSANTTRAICEALESWLP